MRSATFSALIFLLLPLALVRPYFGALLYFWFSLMNPHRLMYAVSLPYAEIIAITTFIGWLSPSVAKKVVPDRTSALLIIWLVWTAVTTCFALNPSDATAKLIIFAKTIGFSLIAYSMMTTRKRIDALITVLVLSVGFFGMKGGAWALLTGGHNRVYGPAESMIGDNNDLGAALLLILPLVLYLRDIYVNRWTKSALLFMTCLTAIAVLCTYSRAAFLGIAAVALFLILKSRRKLLFFVIALASVVLVINFAPRGWLARMDTIETYKKDQSAESRLYMWKLSLAVVEARPIVGGGFKDAFDPAAVNGYARDAGLPDLTRKRAPHSIFFEALGEHGVPGLIIFLMILGSTWLNGRYLVRRGKDAPQFAWAGQLGRMVQVSLIGFCIAGAFGTLATYDGLYVVVIACAAARRVIEAEAKALHPQNSVIELVPVSNTSYSV